MRCLSCQKISFNIICKQCQVTFFKPSFYKRELKKEFFVYSFYNYEEIKEFINSKYYFFGDRVFNILGKLAFKQFSKNFKFDTNIFALSIDDFTKHDFSQTAILTKYLKSKNITPIYSKLKITNIVKYAGKDLDFRQNNKRKFIYSWRSNIKIILVDDIVTTGLTLLEAKEVLEKNNCEVLFALTLSDAKNPK